MDIQIDFLKNHPHTIPTIAAWIYDEWRPYDSSLTKARLIAGLKQRLNDDKIPFTLIALRNSIPIGTISLKEQNEPELTDFPQGIPWLGSLQVVPKERNKGVGHRLLSQIKEQALLLGHKKVLFYTSNPTNLQWLQKRGAQLVETRPFRNHIITIMQISL